MPSSPRKEVTAMDNEYIICFMIVLLLLVISIKKYRPLSHKSALFFINNTLMA